MAEAYAERQVFDACTATIAACWLAIPSYVSLMLRRGYGCSINSVAMGMMVRGLSLCRVQRSLAVS